MQIDSSPKPLRRLVAVVTAAGLLMACTPADDVAPPVATETGDAVLQSRSVLGQPMVELAQPVVDLAEGLAAARYEAERGTAMRRALRDLDDTVAQVRQAAEAADTAAQEAAVEQAAEIVRGAVELARAAADAAEAEVAYLLPAGRIDARLLEVTELWDQPGSQSQIRARLAGAAADAAHLRRRARRLQPAPEGCRTMKRNRVGWAGTVRTRTQRLQEQANSAGGGTFDDLRAAYRRLPFGVEPRTADQQERSCWRSSSQVWSAADQVRASVEALEAALQ